MHFAHALRWTKPIMDKQLSFLKAEKNAWKVLRQYLMYRDRLNKRSKEKEGKGGDDWNFVKLFSCVHKKKKF